MTVKECISGHVQFQYYTDGNLWYKTWNDLLFPVPIEDTKGGLFKNNDKGIYFMRWIRKHLDISKEIKK